ncbi:zona pellucida sperm-binding protein 4-like [Electrophorus electricus]|uniref:zona pellucida sperm-binding protein 4-like n=1 Tax=Electrophorus electricus TaxID=8005 RepID=UPI0015CFE63A|nr:zona pellucida sperm-binding protein 4-like [Electrophorus electricus]
MGNTNQRLMRWSLIVLPLTLQYPPSKSIPGFPPSQRCAVDAYDKVQCGQHNISAADCESINCCFDGHLCYYGKAVTVQCIRDGQFVVVVARATTLPQLSLDSVYLLGRNEASCSPVETTAAFIIYQFPVTACGTRMTVEDGYLVYENAITSTYEVGIGPLGAITRDSQFEYSRTAAEALVVQISDVPQPQPVVVPGPLRVELRLANGNCSFKGCVNGDVPYSSYYEEADYPVTKALQEPVYVELRILERTDPNIVLTLRHCWATSTSDPLSLPQWDLVVNGCPYWDDRYLTTLIPVNASSGLLFPTHYKRFVLKMFTFVDPASMVPLMERVFIHCNTAVCHPTAMESCEKSCTRQRRGVAILEKTNLDTVASSGEVILLV